MQVDAEADGQGLPCRPSVLLRPWLRLLIATPDGIQDVRWADAPMQRESDGYRFQASAGRSANSPVFVKLHLDWPSPWIFDHWGWRAV
jgi:hypothetical protein